MTLRVVLVGLPGVGKSTVGVALAAELEVDFVDLDDVIQTLSGARPATILRQRGEGTFRVLEAEALAFALATVGDCVLATGGGTVESADARALLARERLVVQLVASPSSLLERLEGGDRPLLEAPTPEALDALAARRGAFYDEVADARVDASGPIDDVVDAVARLVVRT